MAVTLDGTDNIWSKTRENLGHLSDKFSVNEQIERLENTYNIVKTSDSLIVKVYQRISTKCTYFANSIRIFNITIVNYGIMAMFGYFLLRLTFKYHQLYTKSSLLATIATNIVLYGISDTCAQSLSQLFEGSHNHNQQWFQINGSEIFGRNSQHTPSATITLSHETNDSESEDAVDVFVDYGDDELEGSARFIGARSYEVDIESNRFSTPVDFSGFDFRRFFGFITWGFIMAFIQVLWYMFLNAMFTDMPTMVSVLERDLTDQLLFSPISLACFFAYSTIVIEGRNIYAYREKMLKLYITTYAVSFSVWFPVQFINFSVMPKKFQVPFSSSVGVIWNCFLSYKNANARS